MNIFISLPAQTLELYDDQGLLQRRYTVSTAKNGAGEASGSFCTPRGKHRIRARIGQGCAENTVFIRRRPTGEIWSAELAAQFPGRDWILTRILWLSGCEPGFNRLGAVDTMRRYVYLHGCPESAAMGVPGSIGCVRMRNADIVELFDAVPVYTTVNIGEFEVLSGGWDTLSDGARQVRQTVFVEAQGIAAHLEWESADSRARHVVARDGDGRAVGTGRLLDDGRIGRLAVLPSWRGKGVGTLLLRHLMSLARTVHLQQIYLHAQLEAVPFYQASGFVLDGASFLEVGAPHVRMQRTLSV
ncbi:MAG: GNAT family N-acetyltransferase [Sterolibacterium sp.]|jgi:predicted GNAT family N-acyltransferase|nr:GNAT family N-acetyltransferase [Sterolibacterium sp.]